MSFLDTSHNLPPNGSWPIARITVEGVASDDLGARTPVRIFYLDGCCSDSGGTIDNVVSWSSLVQSPELGSVEFEVLTVQPDFHRGDANGDGHLNISDAVFILRYLFLGESAELDCERSSDIDDGGSIDLTDAIKLLNQLFVGGVTPLPPHPGCGQDPTPDGLACISFPPCEDE